MSDHTTPTPVSHHPELTGRPLFDVDGRVSGFVLERQGVLYLDKRIDSARHLHRKINGLGIGAKVLDDAIAQGCKFARFHDDQRHTVYFADLTLFERKGVRVDQGHGLQWILPLKFWTVPDGQPDEPVTRLAGEQQMALFGMVAA